MTLNESLSPVPHLSGPAAGTSEEKLMQRAQAFVTLVTRGGAQVTAIVTLSSYAMQFFFESENRLIKKDY